MATDKRVPEGAACGACPRGHRSDGWVCVECDSPLDFYSLFYLIFAMITVPVVFFIIIENTVQKFVFRIVLQVASGIECIVACVCAIATFYNYRWDRITICPPMRLSDWYSTLNNPVGFACSNEAVYPLYSIVLVYYAYCLLFVFLFQTPIIRFLGRGKNSHVYHLFLWWLPALAAVYATCAGLLYYSYPYILAVGSSFFMMFGAIRIVLDKDPRPWYRRIGYFIMEFGCLMISGFCILLYFNAFLTWYILIPLISPILYVVFVVGVAIVVKVFVWIYAKD